MDTTDKLFATFGIIVIFILAVAAFKPDKHGFEVMGNSPYKCVEVHPYAEDHFLAKCIDASICNKICAEERIRNELTQRSPKR